jgi:glycosyltransferase involved in cell wall biosynthesis
MTAYNEEAVIADTVRDCLEVLDGIPGEHTVLVVDDGSTDRTGEILQGLRREDPRLTVLVHPENRGYARAQRWLISEAPGDVIVHLAADGEWRAREMLGMLDALNGGFDIVIGVRRRKHDTAYRRFVSGVYNALVVVLFGRNLRDIGSIRTARASIWKRLPARSDTASFMAEKLLLAAGNGARIGFVPVDHTPRTQGASKFDNPLRALEAFRDLIAFRLSRRSRVTIDLERERADTVDPGAFA